MHAFRRFIRGVLVLVVVLVMAACSAPLVREAEVQVVPPVAAPAAQPIPPRIALALGGGAAFGLARVKSIFPPSGRHAAR